MGLDRTNVASGLSAIALHMEEAAPRLNELDGKLGDGDLGITMVRGSREVVAAIERDWPEHVGECLLSAARAFTKTSGSSFGTLLATGLMAAGKETKGQATVPWSEVPRLVSVAMLAMKARGNAEIGNKTVLDALNAIAVACNGLKDPVSILGTAHAAVVSELDRLRSHPAQIGRARIFGERSVGLDDPGMVAVLTMLEGLQNVATNTEDN